MKPDPLAFPLKDAIYIAIRSHVKSVRVWKCTIHVPGFAYHFLLPRTFIKIPPPLEYALQILNNVNFGDWHIVKSALPAVPPFWSAN